MTAPAFQTASDQDLALNLPASPSQVAVPAAPGTTDGDLLLFIAGGYCATPDDFSMSPPAGFTLVLNEAITAFNEHRKLLVAQKIAASEPASYAIGLNGNAGVALEYHAAVVRYDGADPTAPIDSYQTAGIQTTQSPTVPGLTTGNADDTLIGIILAQRASQVLQQTPPAGMTERVNSYPNSGLTTLLLALDDQDVAVAGPVAPGPATLSLLADCMVASVALKAASSPPPPPGPYASVKATFRNEQDLRDGGGVVAVALSGTTFDATLGQDNPLTLSVLAGLVGDGTGGGTFNQAVAPLLTFDRLIRDGDTALRIVLPEAIHYDLDTDEALTLTLPAAATAAGVQLVATPDMPIAVVPGGGA